MQLESRIVSTLVEGHAPEPRNMHVTQFQNRRELVQQILAEQTHLSQAETKAKPDETRLDIISAAIVIGLTATFITFLFGIVMEFMPRLLDAALLGLFIGLCVSVIAYALMKESD
jgi:predicted AAA+ superfamily ATPase